jgi:hypothetical protein
MTDEQSSLLVRICLTISAPLLTVLNFVVTNPDDNLFNSLHNIVFKLVI